MAAKKKRIMHSLTVKEISGVDVPANEGARSLIMKRRDPEDDKTVVVNNIGVKKFNLETASNPKALSEVDGHQHLIDDSGRAGNTTWATSEGEEFGHEHAWLRNNDGSIQILASEGHTHQLIEKRITSKPATGGKEPIMAVEDEDIVKAADGSAVTQEQFDEMQKSAKRSEQLAELTDAQKAHFQGLEKDDQDKFLELDKDGRKNEVEKATADDPVVYKSPRTGRECRKSGNAEVLEAIKSADEAWKIANEERDLRKSGDLAKRAGELKFVKGKDEVKVALLKAIDGIEDDDLRKGALEIVKSANSGLEQAFTKRGTAYGDGGESSDVEVEYEKKSQEYAKTNSCTIEKARSEVLTLPENSDMVEALTQRAPVID